MEDRFSLSKYRLEKAEEDLKTSEFLLKNNFLAQSLNRSYYAGLNSKTHSGVAIFNKEYIHKKLLPIEYYRVIKLQKE